MRGDTRGWVGDVPDPTWLLWVPCAGAIPRPVPCAWLSLAGVSHGCLVAPTPLAAALPGISTPGPSPPPC